MRGFDILVSETRSRTIYDLESETRDPASHSHAGSPKPALGRLRDGLHGVWLGPAASGFTAGAVRVCPWQDPGIARRRPSGQRHCGRWASRATGN
jgi:hypothetical protein